MSYVDDSRSSKHGQSAQLSMDEQLAAVVLATLSGRPTSLPGGPGASFIDIRSASRDGLHVGQPATTPESLLRGYSRCCPVSELTGIEDTEGVSTGTASGLYMCSWKSCGTVTESCSEIERHIRQKHLRSSTECSNREEDFYYVELSNVPTGENGFFDGAEGHVCSACTDHHDIPASLSHDSVLFDHDYQKKSCKAFAKDCSTKLKTLQPSSAQHKASRPVDGGQGQTVDDDCWPREPRSKLSLPGLAKKRDKHDVKKCRKVYGMTNKRLWCTQCKWKKACSRFMMRTF